jgi:hypothetical protein
MNDGEWIAFVGLIISIIALCIAVYRLWTESRGQKKTLQLMMDYVSILRDNQKSIDHALKTDIAVKKENIQIQKERLAYDKVVAAAKTIGWILDREE